MLLQFQKHSAAFPDYWLLMESPSCFNFLPIFLEVTLEKRTKTETVGLTLRTLGLAELYPRLPALWPHFIPGPRKPQAHHQTLLVPYYYSCKKFTKHLVCPTYYAGTAGDTEMNQVWSEVRIPPGWDNH